MSTSHIQNERPSIVDLSAVKDVEGRPVVLQPKGRAGDSREILTQDLNHPSVQSMLHHKWLRSSAVKPEMVQPHDPGAPPLMQRPPTEQDAAMNVARVQHTLPVTMTKNAKMVETDATVNRTVENESLHTGSVNPTTPPPEPEPTPPGPEPVVMTDAINTSDEVTVKADPEVVAETAEASAVTEAAEPTVTPPVTPSSKRNRNR